MQSKLNPLELAPVLEVLFSHCPFETLKNARLVCKLWFHMSTSAFDRCSLINFYSMYPDTYDKLTTSIEENGCRYTPVNVALTMTPLFGEISKLLNVCPLHATKNYVLPFGETIQTMKFYAWETTSENLNGALFREILLKPKHLRSLDLSLLPSSITSSNEPLFPLPFSRNPKPHILEHLSELTLYGKMILSETFINNFLSAMPNLKVITINCCSLDFLDLFTTTLSKTRPRKMEQLKFNFLNNFSDSHLDNIQKAELSLTTLHLAPRSLVTEYNAFSKLLDQLAPTLEDAKLTICSQFWPQAKVEQCLPMQHMPKLKTLKLQSWRGTLGFWNLSFIDKAPSLENLIIEKRGFYTPRWDSNAHSLVDENQKIKPHGNLKCLTLPSVPFQFPTPKSVLLLLPKFANLSMLTLTADDQVLESIFQVAPQLERLVIVEYSRVTDKGLTGMVPEKVSGSEIFGYDFPINYNLSLGITSMKALKTLEIDGFGGYITDFSVKHGFIHMEKLEYLTLRSCKVTKEGIQLMSKVQLTVMDFDTWQKYEHGSFVGEGGSGTHLY